MEQGGPLRSLLPHPSELALQSSVAPAATLSFSGQLLLQSVIPDRVPGGKEWAKRVKTATVAAATDFGQQFRLGGVKVPAQQVETANPFVPKRCT